MLNKKYLKGLSVFIVLYVLVLNRDILEAVDELAWQQYIKPNAAYLRAQERSPFSMDNPVGLVTSEEEKQRQRQAAENLRRSLTYSLARKKVFKIPPGQYRFADNKGLELSDLEDVTLIANNVTFWFERPESMLAGDPKGLELHRCKRFTIKGLKVDFDPCVFLQAEILEITKDDNGNENGFIIQIDKDFPDAEMDGGSYFLYHANGEWIQHGYLYYKKTERIEGRKHKLILQGNRVFKEHNQDESNLQLTQGQCRIGPGDYVVLPWRRGRGIFMCQCEKCHLENVDLYGSPGMGVLEYQGGGGNVYRRLRIIPPPRTRRLHACAADGFHNAQTDWGPQLIECEITGTSDDYLNLHGHFGVVWRQIDSRKYIIGQANLGEIKPGGILTFYDDLTVEKLGQARVKQLKPLDNQDMINKCNAVKLPQEANRNYYEVLFDSEISLACGDLVALGRFCSAGFLIKDCYFHDAQARTLINGAGDGQIIGNIIERSAWGLVVHFETWRYFEGPIPTNIKISGNVFRQLRDTLSPCHANAIVVAMVPADGGYLRKTHPLSYIDITGNYIEDSSFGILMTNTTNSTIADNTIVRPMYRMSMAGGGEQAIQSNIGHSNYFQGKAKASAISLWSCSNIQLSNNTVIDPDGNCKNGPVQIGDYCENIR